MGKTLFDKIWERHVVKSVKDGPDVLYIDKHLIHEVTSPQAFKGIEDRGLKVFRPKQIVATADHNIPTSNQHLPIEEKLSRHQVDTLTENCKNHNVELYGINHEKQGIIHVISPELGFTQPGMTMVCGDSHTSTHGAFGAVAFGIGTSEVEMVFATQCIMQTKPKTLRIEVTGQLQKGVTAKDLALKVISVVTPAGGAGYFIEFTGEAIRSLSMEGRMTLCNMSIEMGARGGLIAPDEKTYDYLFGKPEAPKGDDWTKHKAFWSSLISDTDASFDKVIEIDVDRLAPIITYGTNPGTGIEISDTIPNISKEANSYKYMNFQPEENMEGKQVDYVFIGSCTNARIEDLRLAASIIKGNKKADHVTAFIVPGSKQVEAQAIQEGLDKIFSDAGFELRQPGCSACLAMNEDKVPAGKYCVSTSNRNFEGRQGPGSRTMLASPLTAAASAIMGKVTDPRTLLN